MRDEKNPASLSEMMGKENEVSLETLPEILGNAMPEMDYDHVGKIRLVHALQQRFGQNYRSIPGVNKTIADFDKQMKFNSVVKKNKES